jgi:hypothetical protein
MKILDVIKKLVVEDVVGPWKVGTIPEKNRRAAAGTLFVCFWFDQLDG